MNQSNQAIRAKTFAWLLKIDSVWLIYFRHYYIIITVITWLLFISISLCYKVGIEHWWLHLLVWWLNFHLSLISGNQTEIQIKSNKSNQLNASHHCGLQRHSNFINFALMMAAKLIESLICWLGHVCMIAGLINLLL